MSQRFTAFTLVRPFSLCTAVRVASRLSCVDTHASFAFFFLSINQRGSVYSIDEGRRGTWTEALQAHITKLQKGEGDSGEKYGYRLTGSAVADVHRTLVRGRSLFLFPAFARTHGFLRRVFYRMTYQHVLGPPIF